MEDNLENNNMSNVNVTGNNNIDRYVSALLLSTITYTLIALSTNIQIFEIVDLELPLIIILSLVLTYFSINNNKMIIYPIYFAAIIITLIGLPQYSFFFIIVVFGELCVEIFNKIFNNKYDYKIN